MNYQDVRFVCQGIATSYSWIIFKANRRIFALLTSFRFFSKFLFFFLSFYTKTFCRAIKNKEFSTGFDGNCFIMNNIEHSFEKTYFAHEVPGCKTSRRPKQTLGASNERWVQKQLNTFVYNPKRNVSSVKELS